MCKQVPLLAASVLLLAAGQLGRADDRYTRETFEYSARSKETALVEALEAFAQEAAQKLLAQPTTADERQARERTLAEVRKRAADLVKYRRQEMPQRPGAVAFVVLYGVEVERAALDALYEQMKAGVMSGPRFKVLVVVAEEHRRERIEPVHVSHEIRPDSKIAAAIERVLLDAGYAVVNGNQMAEIQQIKGDWAKLDAKDAKIIQGIATRQRADIIVRGYSTADGPHAKVVEGRQMYQWFAHASVTVFRADDAEGLFTIVSPSDEGCRTGLNEVRDAGSAIALEKAGRCIGEEFLRRIASMDTVRSPEIKVTIQGVKEFADAEGLAAWIGEIDGVEAINHSWERDIVYVDVKTTMRANELARALETWVDARGIYRLKVRSHSTNAIDVDFVTKSP